MPRTVLLAPALVVKRTSTSSTSTTNGYIGVIVPSGQMTPILDTLGTSVATWPASVLQGWYLISASTTNPSGSGDPWSLAIEPV